MQVSSISGKWLGITLNKYLGTRSKASIFRFFLPLLMMVVYSAKAHRLLKVPDGQYFNFRCGGPSAGMAPSQNAKLWFRCQSQCNDATLLAVTSSVREKSLWITKQDLLLTLCAAVDWMMVQWNSISGSWSLWQDHVQQTAAPSRRNIQIYVSPWTGGWRGQDPGKDGGDLRKWVLFLMQS